MTAPERALKPAAQAAADAMKKAADKFEEDACGGKLSAFAFPLGAGRGHDEDDEGKEHDDYPGQKKISRENVIHKVRSSPLYPLL